MQLPHSGFDPTVHDTLPALGVDAIQNRRSLLEGRRNTNSNGLAERESLVRALKDLLQDSLVFFESASESLLKFVILFGTTRPVQLS